MSNPAPLPAASAPTPAPAKEAPAPVLADFLAWLRWLRAHPAAAAALGGMALALTVFLGCVKLFTRQTISTFGWAWSAWNPETNYEHAKLIPFIALFLLWNAQPKLRKARVGSSNWGLAVLGGGVLLYLAAARTLQPRLALAALPVLLFGLMLYVWGRQVARVLLFPIFFLLFMIPLPGVEQATVRLQLLATNCAAALCNLIGVHLEAIGTTLRATDASFQFEIAGGCSGIHSLMAITMLTAIFVHLTQDRLWKKLALFSLSVVFAIIGNIARITSVMVVAKFFGQKFAGGTFHDLSAWIISFPFAFIAMYFASKLINWRPTTEQRARWLRPAAPAAAVSASPGSGGASAVAAAATRPDSYDY